MALYNRAGDELIITSVNHDFQDDFVNVAYVAAPEIEDTLHIRDLLADGGDAEIAIAVDIAATAMFERYSEGS